MITHIVMFKLTDRSSDNVSKARDVLMSMDGKMPMVRHLEVGIDILHSERSYDLALTVRFDSLEALNDYQVHPVHKEIIAYMSTVREASISVDYES